MMRITKAYKAGYKARNEGTDKTKNPFQYTSNIFMQADWMTGWKQADKELTNEIERGKE